MQWDDLKFFLALYRAGNVRRAAALLSVSHSTVARRFEQFEAELGVKLLERVGSGYALTAAGDEVLDAAERVEATMDGVSRRLVGQDKKLAGPVRITMVDMFATHLLMPSLVRFSNDYPEIDLDIQLSYESLDLRKGEADIALRLTARPPDYLLGRKVGTVSYAGYASKDYVANHNLDDPLEANWIGIGGAERFPRWVVNSGLAHLPARGSIASVTAQVQATRDGMGVGFLPCFIGDASVDLVRVDYQENFDTHDVWLLRHPDTRETARMRVFSDFMVNEFQTFKPHLEGRLQPAGEFLA